MKKSKKRAIIISVIIALVILITALFCIYIPVGIATANAEIMSLENSQSTILKRGYYCGEGNCNKQHGIGVVYIKAGDNVDEFLESQGIYKGLTNEYADSADDLIISMYLPCVNGKIVYYQITGTM